MSNYRILKFKKENDYQDDMYLVQKKRFFGGWKNVDNFTNLKSAKKCLAMINPDYAPEEGEIALECE